MHLRCAPGKKPQSGSLTQLLCHPSCLALAPLHDAFELKRPLSAPIRLYRCRLRSRPGHGGNRTPRRTKSVGRRPPNIFQQTSIFQPDVSVFLLPMDICWSTSSYSAITPKGLELPASWRPIPLPSSPEPVLHLATQQTYISKILFMRGMAVSIGQVEKCPSWDSNCLRRTQYHSSAAIAAIINGELLIQRSCRSKVNDDINPFHSTKQPDIGICPMYVGHYLTSSPRCSRRFKAGTGRSTYAMYHSLKLQPQGRYRKSAAVVGEVVTKYHPHGDSASTMPWSSSLSLSDIHSLTAKVIWFHGWRCGSCNALHRSQTGRYIELLRTKQQTSAIAQLMMVVFEPSFASDPKPSHQWCRRDRCWNVDTDSTTQLQRSH